VRQGGSSARTYEPETARIASGKESSRRGLDCEVVSASPKTSLGRWW
jgi:hypothetical protein